MFNTLIGERICEMRYKSYYSYGKLQNAIIVLYLNFTNKVWYEITVCDGLSTFKLCNEPLLSSEIISDDEVYYPIKKLTALDLKTFGSFVTIEEYFWHGYKDQSCGYNLKFDNNTTLRIIEIDDCLLLNSDKDSETVESCSLLPLVSIN